jgi:hypothetical protein
VSTEDDVVIENVIANTWKPLLREGELDSEDEESDMTDNTENDLEDLKLILDD